MQRTGSSPWRALTLWITLTLVVVGVLVASACSRTLGYHTDSRVAATYFGRDLSSDLDWRVPVPSIAAASEAALRSRGYVVETADAVGERARVVGVRAQAGLFEKTVVTSQVSDSGTRLVVRVEPFGDEPASRVILDEILVRLGY